MRNYYHKLELQDQAGSELAPGYFWLIIAAGLPATGGLLANSAAVIIGAICVVSFLRPSLAFTADPHVDGHPAKRIPSPPISS